MIFINGTTMAYKCLRERKHVIVSVSVIIFLIYANVARYFFVVFTHFHLKKCMLCRLFKNCRLDSFRLPSYTIEVFVNDTNLTFMYKTDIERL